MLGRVDDLAMYTGNDDNIILDLLSPVSFGEEDNAPVISFRGGLLGTMGGLDESGR